MVLSLGKQYGSYVCSLEGIPFYTFPTFGDLYCKLETLESDLRHLGFGYRANYVAKTILALHELPIDSSYLMHPSLKVLFEDAPCSVRDSLYALREREYNDCLSSLLPLSGIGRKVADCICLFSLDKLQCIPIDVHVWRISLRDYKLKYTGRSSGRSSNAGSSLTPKVYQDITNFYNDLFKFYVGWAHTLLFVADLDKFNKL